MRPEDSDYFRARAIEERWLARDSDTAEAAAIHTELAFQYAARADEIDAGTSASAPPQPHA
jgi:hypothetical protein